MSSAPRAQALCRSAALALGAVVISGGVLAAQTGRTVLIAPTYQSWQFSDAVPLDTIRVKSATQVSLPFLLSHALGARWTGSVSGAAFSSTVTTDGTSNNSRTLSGVTDVRLRVNGRIISDVLQLTLGVNVPAGATGLSSSENDVLRVLAAPALGAQVAVPGLGFGGTAGLVLARSIGGWGFAAGTAYEQRGTYSPIDVIIAGRGARTELAPGGTVHVSLGLDGLVGANRLSIGAVGDFYASDEIRSISNGNTKRDSYQLGPTGLVTMALQIANPRIRNFVLQVSERYRSSFKDGAGVVVAGSSGSYLEFNGTGTIGTAGRPSLVLGVDARQHSGLPVDNAFIGAGLTSVGATIGLSLPTGGVEWRPSVHVTTGSLKTQKLSTTMTSIAAGLTISAR
jgi:hypothetical protein